MVKNHQKTSRLKPLLNEVPPGFLVDAAWLVAREIDRKSIHDYVKRGWLEHITRGLYRRPFLSGEDQSTDANWQIAVLSMQRLMGYDVHVGGKTALAMYGHVHYLNLANQETVYLYGKDVPSWLKRLSGHTNFEVRTRGLFGHGVIGVEHLRDGPDGQPTIDATSFISVRWPLVVSSPERAILELINELPQKESFHVVDKIFEGLATLRPKRLEEVLESCRSVKVKRLFFVFADRHQHAWRKYLDPAAYDLGSGPRALVAGGRIHPTYRIYVPKEYVPAPGNGDADGH